MVRSSSTLYRIAGDGVSCHYQLDSFAAVLTNPTCSASNTNNEWLQAQPIAVSKISIMPGHYTTHIESSTLIGCRGKSPMRNMKNSIGS